MTDKYTKEEVWAKIDGGRFPMDLREIVNELTGILNEMDTATSLDAKVHIYSDYEDGERIEITHRRPMTEEELAEAKRWESLTLEEQIEERRNMEINQMKEITKAMFGNIDLLSGKEGNPKYKTATQHYMFDNSNQAGS